MAFRSRRTHLLLAVLYCLLCMGKLTMAKEDRTSAPTMAPTTKKGGKDKDEDDKPENGTQEEEDPKTKAPTAKPTPKPTKSPTQAPTQSPTKWPTMAPSAEDTPAPVESTEAAKPSSTTVTSPPIDLVEIRMASMIMDITTEDGGQVDEEVLESDLETLLSYEVLERVYDSFSHADLNLMLLPSNTTARRLEEGYEADIEGTAFFSASNEIPSEQQLSEFLFTYFSIYDSDDLTARLSEANPDITKVKLRTIDGVAVDIKSIDKGGDEDSPSASSIAPGAIVGLVIGAIVLVGAIGAVIWLRRKEKGNAKGSVDSPARTQASDAPSPSPQDGSDLSLDDDLSAGIISIEDSIYTHNSDVLVKNTMPMKVPDPGPPEQYDANRLDKVISSAQEFVRRDSLDSENLYDFSRKNSFEDVYSENSEEAPPPISNPVSF